MPTRFPGTRAERRTLDTFIKLTRCTNSLFTRLAERNTIGELTYSQFAVLEALYHLGPLSQGQVSAKVLKSGSNMTTVIDNLAAQNKQAIVFTFSKKTLRYIQQRLLGTIKGRDLLLLDDLPVHELLDVGMIDVEDDHLRGAPRRAARLDGAGGPVADLEERHEARGLPASRQRLAGPAQRSGDAEDTGWTLKLPDKDTPELREELPEIDLNVEEADFCHLRMLAPLSVLELNLTSADS